jgi:hypothetical protein
MTYERTLAALKAYRRLMDAGPTFGDSPEKAQRWRKECLAAAVDVREAFWMDSAVPYSRKECLNMSVDEVRRAVDQAMYGASSQSSH